MFKSFLISMFAVFLFALGAAGAWFYLQMENTPDLDAQSQEVQNIAKKPDQPVDPVPRPADETLLDPLPSAVRGPGLDAEKLYQLSVLSEEKRAQLSQYEDRLRDHKLRINAGNADILAAQREVDGALTQVRSLMDSTDKLLGDVKQAIKELQQQKLEVDKKQADLKAMEEKVGAGAVKNIKEFAEIIESMPETEAAMMIKEMWNDGKMDFAIQLLRNIEPRNVAKIIPEIKDVQLMAEIAARYPEAPQVR